MKQTIKQAADTILDYSVVWWRWQPTERPISKRAAQASAHWAASRP